MLLMLLQLLLAGRVHSFDLRSTAKRTLQQDCPIPFNTTLDLTGAAALCSEQDAACSIAMPRVRAGNATAATAAVASILTPCGVGFLGQLTAAGVLLDALLSLTSCNNTSSPASVPIEPAVPGSGLQHYQPSTANACQQPSSQDNPYPRLSFHPVILLLAATDPSSGSSRTAHTHADPPAPAQDPPPPDQAPPPPPPAQAQPLPAAPGPAPRPGRWLDHDTNGCLNLQRIGESMQRPLELCSWKDLEALPLVGEEYQQGYKRVNRAAEYRRGIDGRARNSA
ncbi:hypothetical protein QJQ45_003246 [Haematococcus lacustris]|nr:hypothetical protein QJQ45_003246 [Haematococcus lacustris]